MKQHELLTPHPRAPKTIAELPACCQARENITQYWERKDLRITICRVCGHKYIRLYAVNPARK